MVDTQYQQQIKRLQSQSSIRQVQNRNQLLQRQQQLQQLQNLQAQQQRQQELARQQLQQSQPQLSSRDRILEVANRILSSRKGLIAGDDYSKLSREEKIEVARIVGEAEDRKERNLGRMAVSQAKAQILKSDPNAVFGLDFDRAVAREAIERGGRVDLMITQTVPAQTLVDNAKFKYFPQEQQKEVIRTPLFKNTPYVYPVIDKAKEIYGSPTAVKIREQLSGRAFAKLQATSGNKVIYDTVKGEARFEGVQVGTPEYEKAVQSAMTGQALSSAVLGSIAGVPRVPTNVRIPVRQLENPFFVEVQQPVMTGGKQQTVSAYQIVQETRPPSMMLKSSKDYGLFGNSDNIIVAPSKVKITTSVPSITGEPVVTVTTNNGKRFILNTLTGVSREVTPEELKQFTKTQQYLFRQLGKEKPVVPESTKFNVGEITRQDTGFGIFKGKSKTRFETASRTNIFLETPEFTQYKTEIQFKDITFPNARATGKTSNLKGDIFVKKDVLILDDVKDVNFIKPNPNVKKTPLSLTFGKQEVIETLKPIPSKVPKVKTQIISKGDTSKSYGNIGLLSGSVSRNVNRAGSDFTSDFARGFKDFTKSKTSAQETPRPRTEVIDLAIPKTSTSQILVNVPKQQTSQFNLQVPKANVIQSPINTQSPKQISGLINLIRSAQSQQQKQMLRTVLKMRFGEPSRTPSKNPPKTPIIKLSDFGESKSDKKGFTDSLGFQAEVRRKGRFFSLGSTSSIGEALMKGQGFVDKTLARSFRIRSLETGELVSPSSVSPIFRSSKREAKTFVEKSKFALGGSEQKEIKLFKKSRRSKNVFGI